MGTTIQYPLGTTQLALSNTLANTPDFSVSSGGIVLTQTDATGSLLYIDQSTGTLYLTPIPPGVTAPLPLATVSTLSWGTSAHLKHPPDYSVWPVSAYAAKGIGVTYYGIVQARDFTPSRTVSADDAARGIMSWAPILIQGRTPADLVTGAVYALDDASVNWNVVQVAMNQALKRAGLVAPAAAWV